jgi:hypothetical protein
MFCGHIDQILRQLLALIHMGRSRRSVTALQTTVISEKAP